MANEFFKIYDMNKQLFFKKPHSSWMFFKLNYVKFYQSQHVLILLKIQRITTSLCHMYTTYQTGFYFQIKILFSIRIWEYRQTNKVISVNLKHANISLFIFWCVWSAFKSIAFHGFRTHIRGKNCWALFVFKWNLFQSETLG